MDRLRETRQEPLLGGASAAALRAVTLAWALGAVAAFEEGETCSPPRHEYRLNGGCGIVETANEDVTYEDDSGVVCCAEARGDCCDPSLVFMTAAGVVGLVLLSLCVFVCCRLTSTGTFYQELCCPRPQKKLPKGYSNDPVREFADLRLGRDHVLL